MIHNAIQRFSGSVFVCRLQSVTHPIDKRPEKANPAACYKPPKRARSARKAAGCLHFESNGGDDGEHQRRVSWPNTSTEKAKPKNSRQKFRPNGSCRRPYKTTPRIETLHRRQHEKATGVTLGLGAAERSTNRSNAGTRRMPRNRAERPRISTIDDKTINTRAERKETELEPENSEKAPAATEFSTFVFSEFGLCAKRRQ